MSIMRFWITKWFLIGFCFILFVSGRMSGQCSSDTIYLKSQMFSYGSLQNTFVVGSDTVLGFHDTIDSHVSAIATTTYSGPTCNFDFIFQAVGESVSRSAYCVYVNSSKVVSFSTALSTAEYELSDKFQFKYEALALATGDIIKVECLNRSSDGAWSRAAWQEIILIPANCSGNDAFVEQNGLVVIEMESQTNISTPWQVKSGTDVSGQYIEYTGSNSFGSPPGASLMRYKVFINNPGTYQFLWRSRNGFNAAASDAENDTWLKIDGNDFYGMMGGNKVDCRGDYIKVWVHNMNNWTYNSVKGEHAGVNGFDIYASFNEPGEYTITIGGRSKGHVIDRMVLFKSNMKAAATNVSTPESARGCVGKFLGLVNPDTIVVKKGAFPGANHRIPGVIEGIWFDIGDEGVAHHDYNTGWEGGLTFGNNPRYLLAGVEDVEIETDYVSYVRNGEWLGYTIGSVQNGTYDVSVRVATVRQLYINVFLDSVRIGSIYVPNRRSWTNFYTFTVGDVVLDGLEDNAFLKVEFIDSTSSTAPALNFDQLEFSRTDNLSQQSNPFGITRVYPNPVKNTLWISHMPDEAKIYLFSSTMQLLRHQTMDRANPKIDMSSFPVGLYFIRLEWSSGEQALYKVLKQ